jgi:hypothetical protein
VRGALGGFSLKVPALNGAWTDCDSKAFPLRESDQYRTLLSDSAKRRRFFSLHGISIARKLSQFAERASRWAIPPVLNYTALAVCWP